MSQACWTDQEAMAFLETVRSTPGELVTACRGWTAHDVLAHAVAGGAEIARLVGLHLERRPISTVPPFALGRSGSTGRRRPSARR